MADLKMMAVLMLEKRAICFSYEKSGTWENVTLRGDEWHPIGTDFQLHDIVKELEEHLHVSSQLNGIAIQFIYDQPSVQFLSQIEKVMASAKCSTWQVLQWEPLRDRAVSVSPIALEQAFPSSSWLSTQLLPVLQATFAYSEKALNAERIRVEQQHTETLESLRTDRLRLEAEIAMYRDQLSALKRPGIDELISSLPGLYRNVFGKLSPHDLALLAGTTDVPQIESPWPEPSADSLLLIQKRIRKLPKERADILRKFCHQLPHRLELRAEMKDWLGDDS